MKWPVVPLANALASAEVFVDGDWVESKDQDPSGDVRLIQLADVGDGGYLDRSARFLTSAKARELRCTFLKPGDVLVARMPDPLGRACMFPGDARPSVTVVDVCVVRPGDAGPDGRWLMHCLNSRQVRSQIDRFAIGTTRSRISRSNLARVKVPLPPLPEQRRIAELLDRAEALRAKRRATVAQLDTLTQSIFLDMFGEPTTNPKGWRSSALGNVAATTSGGTPDRMVLEYFGGGIPWVKSGELHQRIVSATEETLTQRGLKESSAKLMPPGTVLVAMYGATVGASAILGVEAATNQAICSILPTQELLADYLVHLLQRLAPTLLAKRVGGAQPNLSQELLRQLVIPLPPYELQQGFVSRVREVDRVRASHSLSLASFDALFSEIQALAFSGQL